MPTWIIMQALAILALSVLLVLLVSLPFILWRATRRRAR